MAVTLSILDRFAVITLLGSCAYNHMLSVHCVETADQAYSHLMHPQIQEEHRKVDIFYQYRLYFGDSTHGICT